MQEQPLLAGALLGSILGGLALAVWGWQLNAGNQRLARQLTRQISAWNDLAARSPAPVAANIAAATLHLSDLEGQSRRLRQGLEAQGDWDDTPAFRGLEDVYFDLVGMVERQRGAYEADGVAISGDEQFGYGQIVRAQQVVSTSEDADVTKKWIQRLHRQRQALDAVLTALRRAAPAELLGVDRSPLQPLDPAVVERTEDFFVVDPAVTAAVADSIETYGLRVRFEGKTAVLRAFLAELKSTRRPLVVRSIEVRPAVSESVSRRTARPATRTGSPFAKMRIDRASERSEASSDVPIVADNDSIFTVEVEGFALIAPAEPAPLVEEDSP